MAGAWSWGGGAGLSRRSFETTSGTFKFMPSVTGSQGVAVGKGVLCFTKALRLLC